MTDVISNMELSFRNLKGVLKNMEELHCLADWFWFVRKKDLVLYTGEVVWQRDKHLVTFSEAFSPVLRTQRRQSAESARITATDSSSVLFIDFSICIQQQ